MQQWVRAITSTCPRLQAQPVISFGAENDALLAEYVKPARKKRAAPTNAQKTDVSIGADTKGLSTQHTKPRRSAHAAIAKESGMEPGKNIDSNGANGETSETKATKPAEEEPGKVTHQQEVHAQRSTIVDKQSREARQGYNRPAPTVWTGKGGISQGEPLKSKTTRMKISQRESPSRSKQSAAPNDFVIDEFVDLSAREPVQRKGDSSTSTAGKKKSKANEAAVEKKPTSTLEPWAIQKNALREKFPGGWQPRKKLSPDAMEGIRGLHEQDPNKYSTEVLAEQFKISPEAIRRILRSKWMMKAEPELVDERRKRWANRHDRIWDTQAELGLRQKRTKTMNVEDPDKFDQDLARRDLLGDR